MTEGQAIPDPALTTLLELDTAVVRGVVPSSDLTTFFDRSFSVLIATLEELSTTPTGPAFAYYARPPGATVELEVGFPTAGRVPPQGQVLPSRPPGGRVATLVHRGGYGSLGESWGRLHEWVAERGPTPAAGLWEVYLTEPVAGGDPADNGTALYMPLRG